MSLQPLVPLTHETLKHCLDRMLDECRNGIENPKDDTPPEQCLLGAIWCMTAIREGFFGPQESQNNN